MVARYGDRTRVTQQVSSWGKDGAAGASGVGALNVETFTAPGTWTWPGKVEYATVTIVGGGGGSGGKLGPAPTVANAAGGGGVRIETVPVTGPVPVVVGAGGTEGSSTPPAATLHGGTGGSTSFGSFTVGGGAGSRGNPAPAVSVDAPADGGGAAEPNGRGGAYGYPAFNGAGGAGGTPSPSGRNDQTFVSGRDWLGFGAAGVARAPSPDPTIAPFLSWPTSGQIANSGNGAPVNFAQTAPAAGAGIAGSSGVVIVRWWE